MVENVPGEMIEMGEIGARKPYLADPHKAWREICYNAMLRKKGDAEAANKFARVQYKNFFGSWPKWDLDPAESIDPGLASHIQANVIRWIKGKQKAAA
jgi:hypothetical protein